MTRAIALSGGADSLFAATIMPPGLALIVDHGLRSGSRQEAAMAAAMARDLGHEAQILTWRPGRVPKTQAAYRAGRYALLAKACYEHKIEEIWTGHQSDDQCETLLLRLSMGSGLMGLSGMAQRTWLGNTPLFRPILHITRAEILRRLRAKGLKAIEDPTNEDPAYPRVIWRRYLSQNPKIRKQALELSLRIGALRNQALAAISSDTVHLRGPGILKISGAVKNLPRESMHELLAACVRWVGGRAFAGLEDLIRFVRSPQRSGARIGTGGTLTSWQKSLDAFTMAPENRTPKTSTQERGDFAHLIDRDVDLDLVHQAKALIEARVQETQNCLWLPHNQMRSGGLILGIRPRFDHEFITKSTWVSQERLNL